MIGFYIIFLGVGIVSIALFLLRKEFMRAYFIGTNKKADVSVTDDMLTAFSDVENSIAEMNRAFYDIANDLDGNYSLHDRELRLLSQRMSNLENDLNDLKEILTSLEIKFSNKSSLEHMDEDFYKRYFESLKLLDKRVCEIEKSIKGVYIEPDNEHNDINKGTDIESKTFNTDKTDETMYKQELVLEVNVDETNIEDTEMTLKDKIIYLNSIGYSNKKIAKTLNIGQRELELIIKRK